MTLDLEKKEWNRLKCSVFAFVIDSSIFDTFAVNNKIIEIKKLKVKYSTFNNKIKQKLIAQIIHFYIQLFFDPEADLIQVYIYK